jgi:hypothetical protein
MAGFGAQGAGEGPHRAGYRRPVSEPAGGTVRVPGMVTAFAVGIVLLLAGAGPSQAFVTTESIIVSSHHGVFAAGSRDLPRRAMNDEVFRNGKGWLIFKGNVDPGWNKRNVQIYKRPCKGCEWTLVKKTHTDGEGRWRTRIYAPQTGYWFWKGLVPKTGDYGKSVTQIYRTYVT